MAAVVINRKTPAGKWLPRFTRLLERPQVPVYILLLLITLGKISFYGQKLSPGAGPDERAHASMVWTLLGESDQVVPDFRNSRLLNDDLSFSEQRNYVFHPPFAYRALIWLSGREDLIASRNLNELMMRARNGARKIAFAVLFVFLAVGFVSDRSLASHLAYGASVVSIPITFMSAATVSNDGLALLGGGLTCFGLLFLANVDKPSPTGWIAVVVGVTTGCLAKLTSGLLTSIAAGSTAVLWYRFGTDRCNKRSFALLLCLASGLVLPAAYYGSVLAQYGSVQPNLQTIAPAEIEQSVFCQSDAGSNRMSFIGWTGHFLYLMGMSWVNPVLQTGYLDRGSPVEVISLMAIPVLALLFVPLGLRRRASSRDGILALAGCLCAVVAVALIHLAYSYHFHILSGYLGGVQARYYLPMLPAIALAAAGCIDLIQQRWLRMLIAAGLTFGLFYADFYSVLVSAGRLTW